MPAHYARHQLAGRGPRRRRQAPLSGRRVGAPPTPPPPGPPARCGAHVRATRNSRTQHRGTTRAGAGGFDGRGRPCLRRGYLGVPGHRAADAGAGNGAAWAATLVYASASWGRGTGTTRSADGAARERQGDYVPGAVGDTGRRRRAHGGHNRIGGPGILALRDQAGAQVGFSAHSGSCSKLGSPPAATLPAPFALPAGASACGSHTARHVTPSAARNTGSGAGP